MNCLPLVVGCCLEVLAVHKLVSGTSTPAVTSSLLFRAPASAKSGFGFTKRTVPVALEALSAGSRFSDFLY
uniref:Putative secreted protein n=1 Tax=Anopheles marajoara TaxID=58244 RepID=A0A2M4CEB5_9DIPT